MAAAGYYVQPTVCHTKHDNLKATYKDIRRRRPPTGSAPVKWPFYDDVDPLFFDDVSVEPPLTFSVGQVNRATVNPVTAGPSSQGNLPPIGSTLQQTSPPIRTGRQKVTLLLSRGEKYEILKSLADSRKEMNANLRELAKAYGATRRDSNLEM